MSKINKGIVFDDDAVKRMSDSIDSSSSDGSSDKQRCVKKKSDEYCDTKRDMTKTKTKTKTKSDVKYEDTKTIKKMSRTDKERLMISLIDKFNIVIMNMIKHIVEYYGDQNMSKLRLVLQSIIKDNPEEPISRFLLNVYKNDAYRHQILQQNDHFFMDEIDNKFSDTDSDTIAKLFEFKTLWTQVDDDTKDFIKKSMMALVKICQNYVLNL
jgi:hypothetical protein